MKEAVKLLERYNKCIAAGGEYFEGDKSFMCVVSIKVPIRKKSGNLSYAPRIILKRRKQKQRGYKKWYELIGKVINRKLFKRLQKDKK